MKNDNLFIGAPVVFTGGNHPIRPGTCGTIVSMETKDDGEWIKAEFSDGRICEVLGFDPKIFDLDIIKLINILENSK